MYKQKKQNDEESDHVTEIDAKSPSIISQMSRAMANSVLESRLSTARESEGEIAELMPGYKVAQDEDSVTLPGDVGSSVGSLMKRITLTKKRKSVRESKSNLIDEEDLIEVEDDDHIHELDDKPDSIASMPSKISKVKESITSIMSRKVNENVIVEKEDEASHITEDRSSHKSIDKESIVRISSAAKMLAQESQMILADRQRSFIEEKGLHVNEIDERQPSFVSHKPSEVENDGLDINEIDDRQPSFVSHKPSKVENDGLHINEIDDRQPSFIHEDSIRNFTIPTNDGGKEVYLSDKQFEDAVELIKSSIALSIHMTNPQRQDDDEFQHVTSVDDNPPSAATSRTSLQSQSIALQSVSNQGRLPRLSNRNEPVTRQRSTSRRPPRSTTGARESKQSLTSRSSLMSIQGIKERLSRIGINRQHSHKQPSMER